MLATVKEATTHPPAPATDPPQPPGQRLGQQMKRLHRYVSGQVMKAMQEQLQGDDLTFSQMTALHQLRAHSPVSVGRLAELTGLSLPAASHLTDRIVQRGYAERRENPEDRRAKLLALTADGEAVLNGMDRRFNETYQMVFGRVSAEIIEAAADNIEAVLQELYAQDLQAGVTMPGCAADPAAPRTTPLPEDTA
ncbi:MarR family winged helix-turn-helix transcriptional regulator [Deinococcus aquiradiocola]|uniref:HTH marR-type domain-containing protein n=1 Tax=Deinococcus aquiradiocola TaxID=393059 RepID=A0A917PK20_9DEIO|nr:MarR family transcriptional regulator [Deinococcus aquiradiocola]GGJ81844.1 hypothetical protein GCM10008939_27260 [Deinococcus aquiradiocola]